MRLEATGLTIGYGRTPVGSDIDLALADSEVLALLGPNGCGKTTLFRTLMALQSALAGEVRVSGQLVAALSRRAIAQLIGYVPQNAVGYFPFTVLETVLMGRTAHTGIFSSPSRRDHAIARTHLERLGIADLAEQPFTRISGGQRQLTLIARALAQEAAILVMDEPTASLDFGNELRVLEQVRRLAADGHAIVLSTHNPDHADRYADRVAVMHGGGIVAQGRPEQILTGELLSRIYEVPIERAPVATDTPAKRPIRVTLPRPRV